MKNLVQIPSPGSLRTKDVFRGMVYEKRKEKQGKEKHAKPKLYTHTEEKALAPYRDMGESFILIVCFVNYYFYRLLNLTN